MASTITDLHEPSRGWRYHSGTAIYVERLREGRLIAAELQSTGIPFYPRDEDADTPAFDLQVDGEALYFGWELLESRISVSEDSGCPETSIALRHDRRPLRLDIHTAAAGDGFFRRRLRLTNLSDTETLALGAATPLAGRAFALVEGIDVHRVVQSGSGDAPYRIGWMRDTDWGHEGNFQWLDLAPQTQTAFGSSTGRSGHSTPFAVAHNNLYGGYLIVSLAWSANWRMEFHCDQGFRPGCVGGSSLRYALMPVAPSPMRLLSPGESVDLPEVHFGLNHESLDSAIQSWHSYLRRHVLRQAGDGRQPVVYNHWGFTEHELSEDSLAREIEIAAEVGAELLMVDAGWYSDAGTMWGDTTGDWQVGNRLPRGLEPVFAMARGKGLRCGLWVEIESAGRSSALAREHPDWFLTRYGISMERYLDFTRPAVAQYAEGQLVRLIERYHLDMLRLDYNMTPMEGGFSEREGRLENTTWRHVEALYAILDRVTARFPDLQVENCASGGGRTDLGLSARATASWVSDWMRMPRALRILNGMSLALPAEYVNRLFGACLNASYRGNPETQLHVIVLGHPAISGLTPSLVEANPEVLALARKYVTLYKDFIRPWHREARLYHHTPVIPGVEASGWCVLENVSADRSRAAVGVFRLVNASEETYHLRLRGLDPARRYRVTHGPGGAVCEMDGMALQEQGLRIRLDTPLTSRLLLCEPVPQEP